MDTNMDMDTNVDMKTDTDADPDTDTDTNMEQEIDTMKDCTPNQRVQQSNLFLCRTRVIVIVHYDR